MSEPDPQELNQAAFLLRLSARPVILAGGGVREAGAGEELARIAEVLDAPVITTWNGKGTISDRHELAAGALFGRPEARAALEDADTVFALGTTFEAAPGDPELNLPAQMIQIDSDPGQIGLRYPLRLGIAGDAKPALAGILKALEAPNPLKGVADRTSLAAGDRTGPQRAGHLREAARARVEASGAEPLRTLAAIRRALPGDTTILHRDPGSCDWFLPFFEIGEPGTWEVTDPASGFPVAEAAAAAGAAPAAVVVFCPEQELIPHLRELDGLEEPGNLTFVVFTDRSDEGLESDLVVAARETGVRVVVSSGVRGLESALGEAVGGSTHTVIESDLTWSPPPA